VRVEHFRFFERIHTPMAASNIQLRRASPAILSPLSPDLGLPPSFCQRDWSPGTNFFFHGQLLRRRWVEQSFPARQWALPPSHDDEESGLCLLTYGDVELATRRDPPLGSKSFEYSLPADAFDETPFKAAAPSEG